MDYYGLLFLYYLKGLSGKSVLRLFFNIEVGGTEQLLPENTSTPTTTPILADIQYPDGLRTDQYFTYRETPTTVSNKARIKTIKGNTLVWNQLVQNGNFADTSVWTVTGSGSSFTVSNNIATVTAGGAYDRIQQNVQFINGHKYLIKADVKKTNANDDIRLYYGTHLGAGSYSFANTTEWQTKSIIKTASENIITTYPNVEGTTSNLTWQQRNMMIIDLTQMGLDITDQSEFTSLFSLSYYSYNQGSLLSFNGNGIKTVGKNLNPWQGVDYSAVVDRTIFLKKGDYVLSTDNGNVLSFNNLIYLCLVDNGNNVTEGGITSQYLYLNTAKTFYFGGEDRNNVPFTLNRDSYVSFGFNNQKPTNINEIQLEFGSTPSDYEPYTSSTLSLPISTYFPNGMDGVGSDYDELTNTKASTRMARVDLGTLEYVYEPQNTRFYTQQLANVIKKQGQYDLPNIIVPNYTVRYVSQISAENNMSVGVSSGLGSVFFSNADYTDVNAFKTAMSGVYLVYPLATPTETPITTEDANEALSLLMGRSVSSNNANQLINIITKGE